MAKVAPVGDFFDVIRAFVHDWPKCALFLLILLHDLLREFALELFGTILMLHTLDIGMRFSGDTQHRIGGGRSRAKLWFERYISHFCLTYIHASDFLHQPTDREMSSQPMQCMSSSVLMRSRSSSKHHFSEFFRVIAGTEFVWSARF